MAAQLVATLPRLPGVADPPRELGNELALKRWFGQPSLRAVVGASHGNTTMRVKLGELEFPTSCVQWIQASHEGTKYMQLTRSPKRPNTLRATFSIETTLLESVRRQ